jgi:hypothetical protein
MQRKATFVGLLCLLAACGSERPGDEHIADLWPRPPDVPESAVLHAGLDGGHWSDCRFDGDRLDCEIYHVRGGLDYSRSYKLCTSENPGTLAGGVNGIQMDGYPTGRESVVLVPLEPPQLIGDDSGLQEKTNREFKELLPLECPIQLTLKERP